MAEKKQLKTKYQKQAEENEARYRELVERARKVERANSAIIDRALRNDLANLEAAQRAIENSEQDDHTEPTYNQPVGAPADADNTNPDAPSARQNNRPSVGGQLASRATDIVKDRAKKEGGTALAQAAKKQVAQTAAKRLLEVIPGIGEVVLAADVANTVRKYWKSVAAVIVGGIVILGLLLALIIGAATNSPASAGTGQVSSINPSNTTEMSTLQKVLSGGVVTKEVAQQILNELPTLKTKYPEAQRQALLNDIEAAAQAIITNADSSKDPTVEQKQSDVLKQKIGQFQTAITSNGCQGAICLPVPAIGQGAGGLCGVTSMVMVILYYNPSYNYPGIYVANQDYGKRVKRPGVKLSDPAADWRTCMTEANINMNAPAGKKDWTRMNYVNSSKKAVVDTMIRSIKGQDPVILYTKPGGTISSGPHIVAVVGYDQKDEPDKGGTFIIHNPKPGNVSEYTRYMDYKSGGTKLTADHLMKYFGGDGDYGYSRSTIMVRKAHMP